MATMSTGTSGSVPSKALIIACALILAAVVIVKCDPPWPPPPNDYLKLKSPADVDKATFGHEDQPTCAYATAANMLAGAGYGGSGPIQARAEKIYGDLAEYACEDPGTVDENCSWGHIDAVLGWWVENHGLNENPPNPYTVITKHGLETDCFLWRHQDGPTHIGDLLRGCAFIGMSIFPEGTGQDNCGTRHSITVWGDDRIELKSTLIVEASSLKVADSDVDEGGDLQNYKVNEKQGSVLMDKPPFWSIDYPNTSGSPVFIRGFVTLSEAFNLVPGVLPLYWVTSYQITQPLAIAATGIRYQVATAGGEEIMWWNATLDPPIGYVDLEMNDDFNMLTVVWAFEDPVAQGVRVTITTELSVPENVRLFHGEPLWTYAGHTGERAGPGIGWGREPFRLGETPWTEPDVTGGFVIGGLEIVRSTEHVPRATMAVAADEPMAELRLLAQYPYSNDPTRHDVFFWGDDAAMSLTRARFGHSYGYLSPSALWRFQDWTAEFWRDETFVLDDAGGTAEIRWPELRGYPRGEDYVRSGGHTVTPIGVVATPTPTP